MLPTHHYQQRLQRVLSYVHAHLDRDLSVEMLSDVAAWSKYHFHRQFSAFFDISVHRYVQLVRLKRASYRLAFRVNHSIVEIALDSGYEAPEAFCRGFKQVFGQTPSEFRCKPNWNAWHEAYQPIKRNVRIRMITPVQNGQIRIVEVKDTLVGVLEHRGAPWRIGDSIRRFIAWRKEMGLHPGRSATFNIFYNDPESTSPDEFRLDLCAAVKQEVEPNSSGVVSKWIPGGRCAVLRHTGPDDSLGSAIAYLYGEWLPASGEELRDFPLYCERILFFPEVPEHEAVTDIYLPLR